MTTLPRQSPSDPNPITYPNSDPQNVKLELLTIKLQTSNQRCPPTQLSIQHSPKPSRHRLIIPRSRRISSFPDDAMPPKKRARANTQPASPDPPPRDEDSMDVDTPQAADTPAASSEKDDEASLRNQLWTDDQVGSLFKGVIRWKPAGTVPPHPLVPSQTDLQRLTSHDFQACTSTSA